MATKKDLVEAYSFSRRRLVTAFLSGAPGGREVEPARPGRTVVGGIALAVLLLAGAAIAGQFSPRVEVDWDQPGLVIDDDTGALYVILPDEPWTDEPSVRSVVNVTSARLILGPAFDPKEVPSEEIARQPKGPAVGIVEAPATVPAPDQLLNSGWTACTGTGRGVRVAVDDVGQVTRADDVGVVVEVAGRGRDEYYLIAAGRSADGEPLRAHRYLLPRAEADQVAAAVGVRGPGEAVAVSERWLNLFPRGGDLTAEGLGLDGAGQRLPADLAADFPGRARIGDWFELEGTTYVLTREGPARASEFAAALVRAIVFDGRRPRATAPPADPGWRAADPPWADADWPETRLDVTRGPLESDEVCAVLDTESEDQAVVHLATDPDGSASSEGTDPGARFADPEVESGHGAVVHVRGWGDDAAGSPYLIDDRGYAYPLHADAVTNLGYAEVDVPVIPDAWLELFRASVALSRDAALCPPATGSGPRCR